MKSEGVRGVVGRGSVGPVWPARFNRANSRMISCQIDFSPKSFLLPRNEIALEHRKQLMCPISRGVMYRTCQLPAVVHGGSLRASALCTAVVSICGMCSSISSTVSATRSRMANAASGRLVFHRRSSRTSSAGGASFNVRINWLVPLELKRCEVLPVQPRQRASRLNDDSTIT